jgi:chromosomal replication initiator protein
VDEVIRTVADFFGVSIDQLSSRSRKRSVLLPRQLAMFLSRRYTDASLTEIGRALGRDHPAVRNAIQVVERAILERAPLRYQVEELASRIERRRSSPHFSPGR